MKYYERFPEPDNPRCPAAPKPWGDEQKIGIYIHVPFCRKKCPYCDFYSAAPEGDQPERYTAAVKRRLEEYGKRYPRPVDTVYFGGGTPNLLGAERIGEILEAVKRSFPVLPGAEITCEVNPERKDDPEFFQKAAESGVNRISMGLQSADEGELRFLERGHTAADAARGVELARRAGIRQISLDLMAALPGQKKETLERSIGFCTSLGVEHLSCYLLKIEENTPFYRRGITPPEEDAAAELYLFAAERLEQLGYGQYEISNFCRPGCESRHNLKYWRCEEYLGIGPSAHSFLEGRRFYFPRGTEAFLSGGGTVEDGPGGSFEEFVLLALRLREGLRREVCLERFPEGDALFEEVRKKAERLAEKTGIGRLVNAGEEKISLTREGFLLSNAVIGELLP